MMNIGYWLSGLIAAAIILIGLRFLALPMAAARGYGMPDSQTPAAGFRGWFAVKGVRDIVSGLFVILLMVNGTSRLLGEFLLIASLIPWGDTVIVLRAGGSRAAALGIHALTAFVIVATGLVLIAGGK